MSDSRIAPQLDALRKLRSLVGAFLREEIPVADFIPEFRKAFAPFDPYPDQAERLAEADFVMLEKLVKVSGGWFNEDKEFIPLRDDWVYGRDSEPYGWIDSPRYRTAIMTLLGEEARSW